MIKSTKPRPSLHHPYHVCILFGHFCEFCGEVILWVSHLVVVSSGGAPTPAGTSVFTKHNWDMGMGYLWLNGWGIYHLMGGAFMA